MERHRLTSAVVLVIPLVAIAVRCIRSGELHCENAVDAPPASPTEHHGSTRSASEETMQP